MSAETIIARGAMVYASALGAQTAQALAAIDRLLAMAGTDKSKLLTAKVRLADAAAVLRRLSLANRDSYQRHGLIRGAARSSARRGLRSAGASAH